jgi:hypothetical protein
MNHIPKKLNDDMNTDPFYRTCCLKRFGGCGGRVERHHALIFAGRQVQEKFCILPACHEHHEIARRKDIKEKFDWVLLNRANEQEIQRISKSTNYSRERDRLNNIHGIWKQ